MRQRNYPTASVFNWRTPAHLLFVSSVSARTARMILQLLAIGTLAMLPLALRRQSKLVTALSLLAVAGALATAVKPHAIVAGEVWSGVLIAASLCVYAASAPTAGAVLGVCAVFLRELAAPYGLLCGIAALIAKRRAESLVWIAGGIAYCVVLCSPCLTGLGTSATGRPRASGLVDPLERPRVHDDDGEGQRLARRGATRPVGPLRSAWACRPGLAHHPTSSCVAAHSLCRAVRVRRTAIQLLLGLGHGAHLGLLRGTRVGRAHCSCRSRRAVDASDLRSADAISRQ